MSDTPRVSLALPVYNGANYLAEAIESVLGQTFADFELVICDNASTDSTQGICHDFVQRDPRVRYHRNPRNVGAAPNFNIAFDRTVGDYFKWVAHDDVLRSSYLERTVAALDSSPDHVLAHTQVQFIDEKGEFIRDYEDHLGRMAADRAPARFGDMASLRHWCFDVFGLIRRSALVETPRIASYIGSDRNLLAELALRGKFHRVPEPLFLSREHSERSIRSSDYRERAAWFAPELERRFALPHWRHLREYWRSVHRVPLSMTDRLLCYRELLTWSIRSRRALFHDLRHACGTMIGRRGKRE